MVTLDPETHIYRDAQGKIWPGVTEILTNAGIIDKRFYTEESRNRGEAVHRACHFILKGTIERSSIHPDIVGYVKAFDKFLVESGFDVHDSERVVFNQKWKYSGTLDMAGGMNHGMALIDIKSGICPAWAALQTAAYMDCLDCFYIRYGLELREDGSYRLIKFSQQADLYVFTAALSVMNWKKKEGNICNEQG